MQQSLASSLDPGSRRRVAGRFSVHVSCVVLALALASTSSAEWNVVGQIGGPTSAVAVDGNLAYVGSGFRLGAWDIADPTFPREKGTSAIFSDLVTGVTISQGRAYVAAGSAGLHVLDVSDPTNPRELSAWDSPGSAEGVAIDGGVAYVADGPFGLQIVDVSNILAPKPISSAFDTQYAFDVVVEGLYAYVAAGGKGLLIADISDPTHPRELAALDTPGYARDLARSGSNLVIADEWGGVRIVSIADPLHPVEVGSAPLPSWAFGVAVSGANIYVADGSRGLQILDIADPSRPRALGEYAIPEAHTWSVVVAGDRALVAVRSQGIEVVDVHDPAAPTRLGVVSPLVDAVDVAAEGDLVFVASANQGMRIVDLSDPTRPRERGPQVIGLAGVIVAAGGQHAFLQHSWVQPKIDVYDVADPDHPDLLGSVPVLNAAARQMVREGDRLYTADELGMQVVDVANPEAPFLAGVLDLSPGYYDPTIGTSSVAASGPVAYLADGSNGVQFVDVRDPANLQVIGAWLEEPPWDAQFVALQDDLLYVIGRPPARISVVDVHDPANPSLVGTGLVSNRGRIVVSGVRAFIAGGSLGTLVVDVSDPTAPVQIERIALPGFARAVARSGDKLLVAAGDLGLFVLEETTEQESVREVHGSELEGSWRVPVGEDAPVVHRTRKNWPAGGTTSSSPMASEAKAQRTATGRVVVVTSASDSGPGSLRNALAGLQPNDQVIFDPLVFPPGTPETIRPASELPCICAAGVTVDASNAGVILDGSSAPAETPGLLIRSSGNSIKGLQIVNFPASGLFVNGDHNVIGGDRSQGSGPSGEGNVISRNRYAGVNLAGAGAIGNRVVGNLIGTDVTGDVGLGGQSNGVMIFPDGKDNVIGGTEPWEANVIAGNDFGEVMLQHTGGNTIVGNFIGTDPTGTSRVGRCDDGVATGGAWDNLITANVITGASGGVSLSDPGTSFNQVVGNWIGVNRNGVVIRDMEESGAGGVNVAESFNRIANNVIGGMGGWGITIGFKTTRETIVTGNMIGTDASGTIARPNGGGMLFTSADRSFIGGAAQDERNVISGNRGAGIQMYSGGERAFVIGNLIGVGAGSGGLGNAGAGINIHEDVFRTFAQENVIADNGAGGISVAAPTNRFRSNSIYDNHRGEIQTNETTGIPARPVITSVTLTAVVGTACAQCTVEIFSDLGAQGRWYEGTAIADTSGRFTLVSRGIIRGPNVTATATDLTGSTSAFSSPVSAPPRPPRRRAVRRP